MGWLRGGVILRWSLLPLLIGLLLLPFVLRQNAWYEWSNAYWLVQKQADAIRHLGHPTYFVHFPGGEFYPEYVFYGGSISAVGGYLTVLTGSPWGSFLVITVLAFAFTFGGTYWLARQLGVGRALALAPATVVLVAPYYVSLFYGRGAWPELVAFSGVPVVLAAVVAVASRPRLDLLPVAALFLACAMIAGTHNITLLWGGLFCLVALLALWYWAHRRGVRVGLDRLAAIVLAGVAGVLVNFWFLLPDIVYAHDTRVYVQSGQFLDQVAPFDRLDTMFRPYNHIPIAGSPLYAQLPVYPLVWALVAGIVVVRRRAVTLWKPWLTALGLCALLVAMVALPIWPHLPASLQAIQFPFRLDAYIILAVAGLVAVALIAVQRERSRRVWVAALVAALAVQGGLALAQVWGDDPVPNVRHRTVVQTAVPIAFQAYQQQMYLFRNPPGIEAPRTVAAAAYLMPGREAAVLSGVARTRGARFATDVVYSPFVRVRGGARVVGKDQFGHLVLQVDKRGAWNAGVETARPFAMKAGIVISAVTAVLVLLGFAALAAVSRRGRRAVRKIGSP